MKKKYTKFQMEIIEQESAVLLTGSGVYTDNGIGYGGVDDEGNIVPE
jgi:hypothetical protein